MADPVDSPEPALRPDDPETSHRSWLAVAGAVVLVAILVLAFVLLRNDEDESDVATDSTTSTSAPTSTEPTETTVEETTSSAPTTVATTAPADVLTPDEVAFTIWPSPESTTRFDDPAAAATSFATDLIGFTDPIVGPFQQGDARSGEVEVRAISNGPAATVLIRQYGPADSWWVIGAITPDIEVDEPQPQTAIDDPLRVSGRARAFEGTVQVAVYGDAGTEPLGTGFVTASGDETLGPFSEEISWSNPDGGWGSVVLFTLSAEDGRVWQASATRVGFIGGD